MDHRQPSDLRAVLLARQGLRLAIAIGILALCLWAVSRRIGSLDPATLGAGLASFAPRDWALAAGLATISFWAVGRYDAVAHRHLRTGVCGPQAQVSGTVAIALSQTLGLGIVTGALARWRMLPGLGAPRAVMLSTFVAVSFLAGWLVVTAVTCLVLPAPRWTLLPALAVIATLPVLLWAVLAMPGTRRPMRLPTLRASGAIVFWTAVDTLAAAGVLYVLLPAGAAPSFAVLYPVFLLALGAGLISGAPGGVGPFELVLLALLPSGDALGLLTGVVGFRLVYFAAPACLALLALLRPCRMPPPVPFARPPRDLTAAARADAGVIRQNGGRELDCGASAIAVWPTRQTLTALFDPLEGPLATALPHLVKAAADDNRIACLYKTSGRGAVAARRAGWTVVHLADEAVVTPATFDPGTPARRTLRRKLRAAKGAGVAMRTTADLPLAAMADVDARWRATRGPARAGTMGRFDPGYVARQHVVLAWHHGRLCGFASFHTSRQEWCLDLMRTRADAPDGTMHAIIHHAIGDARAARIPRLSLAAVPACADPHSALHRWAARQVVARAGGPGLRQFKSAFGPDWRPRYVAAPGGLSLAIALADIARHVTCPAPMVASRPVAPPHNQDEDYEIATPHAS